MHWGICWSIAERKLQKRIEKDHHTAKGLALTMMAFHWLPINPPQCFDGCHRTQTLSRATIYICFIVYRMVTLSDKLVKDNPTCPCGNCRPLRRSSAPAGVRPKVEGLKVCIMVNHYRCSWKNPERRQRYESMAKSQSADSYLRIFDKNIFEFC